MYTNLVNKTNYLGNALKISNSHILLEEQMSNDCQNDMALIKVKFI